VNEARDGIHKTLHVEEVQASSFGLNLENYQQHDRQMDDNSNLFQLRQPFWFLSLELNKPTVI